MCGISPRSRRFSARTMTRDTVRRDLRRHGRAEISKATISSTGSNAIELRDAETEARLAAMRAKLFARRSGRVRPGFDDKVLADWNGLMIAALANAAMRFDQAGLAQAAEAAFDFVCLRMSVDGRLFHAYRAGEAKAPATANDYANMIKAALALANATGRRDYVERAAANAPRCSIRTIGPRRSAAITSRPTIPAISSCGRSAGRTRRRRTRTA